MLLLKNTDLTMLDDKTITVIADKHISPYHRYLLVSFAEYATLKKDHPGVEAPCSGPDFWEIDCNQET